MSQFNYDLTDKTFSSKFKDLCSKLLSRIFDLKNLLRVIELVLMLFINIFYSKKPFVNWSGLKID